MALYFHEKDIKVISHRVERLRVLHLPSSAFEYWC